MKITHWLFPIIAILFIIAAFAKAIITANGDLLVIITNISLLCCPLLIASAAFSAVVARKYKFLFRSLLSWGIFMMVEVVVATILYKIAALPYTTSLNIVVGLFHLFAIGWIIAYIRHINTIRIDGKLYRRCRDEANKARHIADEVTKPMTEKNDPSSKYVNAMLVSLLFGSKVDEILSPDHHSDNKQNESKAATIKDLMAYITEPHFSIETFLKRKELDVCGAIEDELKALQDHSPNWIANIFANTYLAMDHYISR